MQSLIEDIFRLLTIIILIIKKRKQKIICNKFDNL